MKALLAGILCLVTSISYGQMIKMGGLVSSRYDTHVVEKGETLYSISKSFNTTVGELLKLNPDIHNNQLDEGRIINVPVSKVVLNGDPNRNALDQEDSDEVLVLAAEDINEQGSSDPDGKAH
ncbi:MAG: LysM peptidoglycan-binding domain-containing protein [Bacteroidetes bacterium]|nr:LysM peptidoglycan-binding domain-containing protein [Bacteroidota bacterium]